MKKIIFPLLLAASLSAGAQYPPTVLKRNCNEVLRVYDSICHLPFFQYCTKQWYRDLSEKEKRRFDQLKNFVDEKELYRCMILKAEFLDTLKMKRDSLKLKTVNYNTTK